MGVSKPRVLHVAAADYAAYHILLPLLEGLAADYDITMACSPGPDLDRVAARGIRVQPVQIPRKLGTLQHLSALLKLTQLMRTGRYDMVHTHTPIASMLARPAARLAGLRRVVYTAHGFYFHDRMPPALYRSHVLLERMMGRLTSQLITVSSEDAQTAQVERIMPVANIAWIPNGVDVDHLSPQSEEMQERILRLRQEFGLLPAQPVVGMVGRLVREKGFFDFVEAAHLLASRFPNAVFVCVGGALPSDRENPAGALAQRVKELGLTGRILFPGFRKDAVDFIGMMDVFCLPSYREGLPLVVLEAMALEKPTVVTNIRGCRELIRDGENGYVVEPGSPVHLAEAIGRLLSDPEAARQMGETSRRKARETYSIELNLQRHRELYRLLLGTDRRE